MSNSKALQVMADRARAREQEHERRMREDPEYRARIEQQARDEEALRQKLQREEEEARRLDVARGRAAKRIPERFWPFLDAWRVSPGAPAPPSVAEAHRWIRRFAKGSEGWTFLFLAGPRGVGKTSAACWFLDEPAIERYREPVWNGTSTATEYTTHAVSLESYDRRFVAAEELARASTYADDYWDEVRDTGRLVIDDLGVESLDTKGYAVANISHLLAHRYARELPTVITLNVTRARFEERYGAHDGGRLVDRLKQSGYFAEILGPSLRSPLRIDDEP